VSTYIPYALDEAGIGSRIEWNHMPIEVKIHIHTTDKTQANLALAERAKKKPAPTIIMHPRMMDFSPPNLPILTAKSTTPNAEPVRFVKYNPYVFVRHAVNNDAIASPPATNGITNAA